MGIQTAMIDETLAKLSRDLIAASDKLESEDFKARQARFVEIEAERQSLAESLEADEAAVVAAQEALQAHFRGSDGVSPPVPEVTPEEFVKFHDAANEQRREDFFRSVFDRSETLDEFSSSRANGAYAED